MAFLEQYKKTGILLGESNSKVFEYCNKKDPNKKIAVKVIECLKLDADPSETEAKLEEAVLEAFRNYYCCHPSIIKCHGIQKKLEFDNNGKMVKMNILIALDKMKENLSSDFKAKCASNTEYTLEEMHKIMTSTISALHYLENLKPPLAHRDIKLANIFIDENGNILIGDVGSAKEIHLTRLLEEANKEDLVATASFAAPEVDAAFRVKSGIGVECMQTQAGSIDWFRADVFSLGMCFLMLMSLKKPQIVSKDVLTWTKKREFIDANLKEVHKKYGKDIQALLEIMLADNEINNPRPTFVELVGKLKGESFFADLNKKINRCSEIFDKRSIVDFYSKTPASVEMNKFLSNNRPRCKSHGIELSSICRKCKAESEDKMFLCYLCLVSHNQEHISTGCLEDFFVFLSPTHLEKDYYMFLNELEEGLSLFDAISKNFREELKNLKVYDQKMMYLFQEDAENLTRKKRENVFELKTSMKIKKDQILKDQEKFVGLDPEENDFQENFDNFLKKIISEICDYKMFKEKQIKNMNQLIENYSFDTQNKINEILFKEKGYSKEGSSDYMKVFK